MDKIIINGEIKKESIYNFFDYFLLLAIIALTGFEFFFRDKMMIYFILAPISFILFFLKNEKIPSKLIVFLGILLLLFILQSASFDMPYSLAFTGVLRFFVYFLIISIVGVRFNKVFVNIMYAICIIGVSLFILTLISTDFYDFLVQISQNISSIGIDNDINIEWSNPSQNIIIYVIPLETTLRNNGPFWEPGMFAVFINIALAINLLSSKRMLDKKNIVFIIASITTFSTASLIATFIILLYHFLFVVKNRYSILFMIILPFIVIPVFNSQYIMGKINYNVETIDKSDSRFGAALVHFDEITKSPIIGHGANVNESLEKALGELGVSPNGLTNIFRVYGIPFSILLYILLFKAASYITKIDGSTKKTDAILLFLVLLIVAFSQDVSTRYFYYILFMIPLTNINNKIGIDNIIVN
jgi:hypothetical protein